MQASIEDYLKMILELQFDTPTVNTTRLAEALKLSPPSVTAMLKRLSAMDLVDYTPYQGCALKEEGRRIALKLLRCHRILETWLVERLGYAGNEVDEEAERLEHALSDRVVDRMEELLGFPKSDPHGSPIPDRQLRMERLARPASKG